MKTPDDYRHTLQKMGVVSLRIEASTKAEAKEALKRVRQLQQELRQVKREIALDVKTIRAHYRERKESAAAGSSAILTLFGKRGAAGQVRASERRTLTSEADRQIRGYEDVKLTIDDLLTQMDKAKAQIEQYIRENT